MLEGAGSGRATMSRDVGGIGEFITDGKTATLLKVKQSKWQINQLKSQLIRRV